MKFLRKVLILAIICWVVFIFRVEIIAFVEDFAVAGTGNSVDKSDWGGLREKAYEAAENGNHDAAIQDMQNYLQIIDGELRQHDGGRQGLLTVRGDILCELSVIHQKLSDRYYHAGDVDLYYHHLRLHREFLHLCSQYREQ